MSRYTPKRATAAKGGGPARPKSPAKRNAPLNAPKKKPVKKAAKPGAFACKACDKRFRTEEALATHAHDAHAAPIDLAALSPLSPGMVRCPDCGAPVRKRNLERHKQYIHEAE